MIKVQVKVLDPELGRIVAKTFEGLNALEMASIYLKRQHEIARQ